MIVYSGDKIKTILQDFEDFREIMLLVIEHRLRDILNNETSFELQEDGVVLRAWTYGYTPPSKKPGDEFGTPPIVEKKNCVLDEFVSWQELSNLMNEVQIVSSLENKKAQNKLLSLGDAAFK